MAPATALTGTPGTGKSSVAAALSHRYRVVEVGELALELGAARRTRGGLEVDLPRLSALVRRPRTLRRYDLVVGHLAHLLPLRNVVVLRCDPLELSHRLARARRGSPSTRRENARAEALDVVLLETLRPGRRVWEFDTTGRSVRAVARDVARCLARPGPSRYGRVDWLADPRVTEGLLDRRR
jgi:adenylate kinase